MFAYKKKVVPLQRQTKNDSVYVTLGYGVMVTQQILVLFFLVRKRSSRRGYRNLLGLWCNGNTTDSGPVFLGSNPGSPT